MFEDTLIGQRLDEYHLQELLGQGGMARVYRALDVRLQRWVAVKVIDKPYRADQNYTSRFEHEARSLARLEHPHVVRVYRYGQANGLLYMVLQYIEGAPLNQVLATYRQDDQLIEPAEASRINREVCSALDYVHSRGVIHRDVKPANIILNRQGNAILADFGLALLADRRSGVEAFGTPQYIAPEQARSNGRAVPQSDLYAMGVILYQMFTGRLPFDGDDPWQVAQLHLSAPVPPPREFRPALHHSIETVILKALAKEPEARYPSGLALANALDRALAIASGRGASSPATLSHLSIPERVVQEMGQRVLPPLPAVTASDLTRTRPASAPEPPPAQARAWPQPEPEPTRRPVVTPAPPKDRRLIVAAIIFGLIFGLVLGLVALRFLTRSIDSPPPPAQSIPTSPPPIPTTLPPPAAPQLIADSRQDFSGTQAGSWSYLVSQPDKNDFEGMDFEERVYGACWYADEDFSEDYVRICPGSGHPGNHADIAWRWTSDISGLVRVVVSAAKIDAGGDGVIIIAYLNGDAVEGLRLEPDDVSGVSGRPWFEARVEPGDHLTFVMKRNDRVEYDHTAFQVQIYWE